MMVLVLLLVIMAMCKQSTLLWNSFMNCKKIIEWYEHKSYKICKNFNVTHMKGYEKHMHGWNDWSMWPNGS